jgi:drug/metabolite transporter (DMT)-like permease
VSHGPRVATKALNLHVLVGAAVAMLAFAGNSLLCRLALQQQAIDPWSFTALRLTTGALVLGLVCRGRPGRPAPVSPTRPWWAAVALLAYATGFSLAYVQLPAASGALLLFATVQLAMLAVLRRRGQRLSSGQWVGAAAAAAGLLVFLLPVAAAPRIPAALLMVGAGVGWAAYTVAGQTAGDPLRANAAHFSRAAVLSLAALALSWPSVHVSHRGLLLAVASGGLASGMGYAVWYAVLPALGTARAATVQLSVPVLAAMLGALLLDEPLTRHLALCAALVLGGVGLSLRARV